MKNTIFNLYDQNNCNWDKVYEAISVKQRIDTNLIKTPNNTIFIGDYNYPDKLKEINLPPFFLFYKGKFDLINNNNIITVNTKLEISFLEIISKNKKEFGICINENNLSEDVFNFIKDNKIELIILIDQKIENSNYFEKINIENQLLISEYHSDNISIAVDQKIERLLFAFADEIIINEIWTNSNVHLFLNIDSKEKPVYSLKTGNLKIININQFAKFLKR